MTAFTDAQRAYLAGQRLGRMATVDLSGQPQANPVGFFLQDDDTVLIGGHRMGASKRWRNLQANPKISLVVDDLASVTPWKPRFVEIRGTAELLTSSDALGPGFSPEVIRIHPHAVHSWGLDG
ncbi:PPOX class F420-dependent oxidoreductase [Streptomyces sp. NPDC056653]|uniref:PPOX class F420-dependent oxidoreductase n=1 Tax=Streptomyces sp. NPDC056653 TaxID=3345894 RepID=UPI0036AEA366